MRIQSLFQFSFCCWDPPASPTLLMILFFLLILEQFQGDMLSTGHLCQGSTVYKDTSKDNGAARHSGVWTGTGARSLAVCPSVKWSQSDTKEGLKSTSEACSALAEGCGWPVVAAGGRQSAPLSLLLPLAPVISLGDQRAVRGWIEYLTKVCTFLWVRCHQSFAGNGWKGF